MKTTVFGLAGGENQPAAYYTRAGKLRGAHAYQRLELALPPGGAYVDLDHDGTAIGTVIFGELDDDGMLRLVTVLDSDEITRVDQPIYFSTTTLNRGDIAHRAKYVATSAELLSVALTLSPASVAPQPVAVLSGDVRSGVDRSRWPLSWPTTHPLLARTLDHLGTTGLEHRTAHRLVDRRDQPDAYERGWVDGESGPGGPLHYSAPYAGIISVR